MKILVVDDDTDLGEILVEFLGILGHEPISLNCPIAALQILRRRSFDLVFCDFKMPEMSGSEFYRTVTMEQPEMAERFVFLTGMTMSSEFTQFLAETGTTLLPKPFHLQDVEDLLAQHFSHATL